MRRTKFCNFDLGDEVSFLRVTKCRTSGLTGARKIKKGQKGVVVGLPDCRKGMIQVALKKGFYLAFKREIRKVKPKQNERKRKPTPKKSSAALANGNVSTATAEKRTTRKRTRFAA